MKTIILLTSVGLLALIGCKHEETELERNYRLAKERSAKTERVTDSMRRARAVEVVIINR